MKTDHNILAKIDRDSGMTVPDGYFADFASRIEAAIPANRPKIAEAPRSFWQQVRPYAYLAAMFAGIWCMLQMFDMMGSGISGSSSIDSNPVLAQAINDESFVSDYIISDMDDYDIYDELYAEGITVDDLAGDR